MATTCEVKPLTRTLDNKPSMGAATSEATVFINPASGSAAAARSLLDNDQRVKVRALQPASLREALEEAVRQNQERVIVSGGDGTLSLAASCLAGSNTALGVLPGGTLNHFAKRIGVPVDYASALDVALTGTVESVSIGSVNGQSFINTSSVGTYVSFVRTREYLERRMGYKAATILAAIRRFVRLRSSALLIDGRKVKTPQLFVGVDERELQYPHLGHILDDGGEGLHLLAARSRGRWESAKIALKSVLRGAEAVEQADELENHILHEFSVDYPRQRSFLQIAIDGELIRVETPLRYAYQPAALRVVVPQRQ